MELLKNVRKFSIFWYSFGFIGNWFIIAYFLSVNRGKLTTMTNYHFLLIVMAVFDNVVCLSQVVSCSLHLNTVFYTNLEMLIDTYVTSTTSLVSIWILVLVSFTRYQRIASPFTRQWRKNVCFKIILIIWCLFSLYQFLLTKIPDGKYSYLYFNSCFLIFEGVIPQILMFYFSWKACQHIKKDTTSNKSSKTKRRNASKTLRGLVILNFMTVFILKTILYVMSIVNRIETLSTESKIIINYFFTFINFTLYYSTNILNVVIYTKMMPNFRRFIMGLFKKNKRNNERKDRTSSIRTSSMRTSSMRTSSM